jgi:hypothetical protein
MMCSFDELAVRRNGEEVSVSKDRELSLEAQQISSSSTIKLALFRHGVPSIPFRDVTSHCECGRNESVRRGFGLASCVVSNDAQDFTRESNSFLPNFEIAHSSGHAREDGCRVLKGDTAVLRPGPEDREDLCPAVGGRRPAIGWPAQITDHQPQTTAPPCVNHRL